MSRFARKVDATHGEIVDVFRAAGATVFAIQSPLAGCPDLIVGMCGRTHLVEVKKDNVLKNGKRGVQTGLSDAQAAFARSWRGGPVHLVHNATEAMELANLLRMTGGLKVVS